MSTTNNHNAGVRDELVISFHRVKSLLPQGQKLLAVEPETPVKEALALMREKGYSQLPVVAGDAVLGVFSFRSFSARVSKLGRVKDFVGDRPVEDMMENFTFVHSTEDWKSILRHLDQDDAFFVGYRNGLEGLVTTMDVLNFFQQLANPFIMIAEIEISLRQIIQECIQDEEEIKSCFVGSLESIYGDEVPEELKDMTFNDCISIIANRNNWPHFTQMFGDSDGIRSQTEKRLKFLGKTRNVVFHFRRRLQEWELEKLADYRDWLQRRVRAFEGRRRKKERVQAKRLQESKQSAEKTTRDKFLAQCGPAAADFFTWMLDEAESRGMTIYWGTKGFAVKTKWKNRLVGFAYGYPPDDFKIFLNKTLELSPTQENAWRKQLTAYGIRETGGKTLRAAANEVHVETLREAFSLLLDKVEAYTLYPLPIRAVVDGKITEAKMLDAGGRILLNGEKHRSPSGAGMEVVSWKSVNGWQFWEYFDETTGQWELIDRLRTAADADDE